MLYQSCGPMALWMNSPKCILVLTIKKDTLCFLQLSVSGCKNVWHKRASYLLLSEGVELPNSVHISLEKVLVFG